MLTEAYRLAPADRDVRYWLGNALRLCAEPVAAEQMFRQLADEFPADVDIAFALAFLLRAEGRPGEAAGVLLQLAKLQPQEQAILLKVAGFLRDSDRYSEAITVMHMALDSAPEDASLQLKLARLYQAVGQFDAASSLLRNVVRINPRLGAGWLLLSQLQRFSDCTSPDWRLIEEAVRQPLGEEADMCLAFAYGKGLDDLGQWQSAWQAFSRGNRLRHAAQPWDTQAWKDLVSGSLQSASQAVAPALNEDRHPVFIVGMLRSGTTLLEQMLDRHPGITGRGELNFLAHLVKGGAGGVPQNAGGQAAQLSAKLGNELWTRLRLDGSPQQRYIDKNPLNFRFIGFLLRIMPEAKIVHVTRDGRDSCLSCFCQLLQHPDAGFSNSLDDLLNYYRGYRQIMDKWQQLAGDRIHTVAYHDLVCATRPTLQATLAFLGLDWDAKMEVDTEDQRPVRTASAWQARQPLHQRSLSRWQNYHAMAPAFFDALAKVDEAAGAR
jgi:tetratricopeptide (TPR) repeat protein